MNPLLLSALFSFGPSLLSSLFPGLFGKTPEQKARADLAANQGRINWMNDPRTTQEILNAVAPGWSTLSQTYEAGRRGIIPAGGGPTLGDLIQHGYQAALQSPAYAQAQRNIATGGNVAQGDLSRALAARGIGTSGIGAVTSAAIPSMVGGQLAGLQTGAYAGAQSQAQQTVQDQIKALLGTNIPYGPSQTSQLFAGGLESFAPILQAWLGAKYPNLFNFSSQAKPATP